MSGVRCYSVCVQYFQVITPDLRGMVQKVDGVSAVEDICDSVAIMLQMMTTQSIDDIEVVRIMHNSILY